MNKFLIAGLFAWPVAAIVGYDAMNRGPITTFAAETLRILQCSDKLPNGMPCPSPKTAQSIPAVKPTAGTENLTVWADTDSNKPGLILERASGLAATPGGLWADQVYSGLKDGQKRLVIENGRWLGDNSGLKGDKGDSCEVIAGGADPRIVCGTTFIPLSELKGEKGDKGDPGPGCTISSTGDVKCGTAPAVNVRGPRGTFAGCRIETQDATTTSAVLTVSARCQAGEILTGGGCSTGSDSTTVNASVPSDNSYTCAFVARPNTLIRAEAICCRTN